MKTIAICDDNRLQLERAMQMLQRHVDNAGIDVQIELFEDAEECIAKSIGFDAVFMDIEFDEAPLGIEAVARINEMAPNCQIVYLTNYLHYSLDVYGTDHAWYVLKDQLEQRLPEILHKLQTIDQQRHSSVVVKPVGESEIVTLPCDEVCYLERSYRITHIVMQDGTRYDVREKLPEIMDRLPDGVFARCHNSYAVNLSRLERIRSTDLDLKGGNLVPISRKYSKSFRAQYLNWAENWTV